MRNYTPVGFTNVKMEGAFWRERLDTVLGKTIASQHKKLVEMNMIEALKCIQPPPPLTIPRRANGFTTQIFWDSDIGKWVEAASYALGHGRDADIEAKIDEIVDLYAAAQLPDGYLNTWYIGREIENRWTNLRDNHELYNCGHLLEGAIAYFQATGRRKFLDIMERYLDHIATVFGRGPGQKRGYPGHEEIEIALVKLYRLTRQQEVARSRHLFHRRARAAAALFRPGSGGARGRSQEVRAGDLRVLAVAHPGARADQGGGARGARVLPLYRDGGPCGRDRRRGSQEGLRDALGRRDVEADVRHGRVWSRGVQRRVHHRLRPAQRQRLCGNLRDGRDGVLGAEHAEPRSRRQVRRRDGARRSSTAGSRG